MLDRVATPLSPAEFSDLEGAYMLAALEEIEPDERARSAYARLYEIGKRGAEVGDAGLILDGFEELEKKIADPEAFVTREDLEKYAIGLELSKPEPRAHVDEDGLLQADDDYLAELDEWNERPIAESLRRRLARRGPRIHVPPRSLDSRPLRGLPRPGRQTRTSRRIVRARVQAAHGPPREPREDPEPPLARSSA